MSMNPPRIFLGPVETSGYFAHLRRGLTELGIRTTFWDLNRHRFAYGGADDPFWGGVLTRAARGRWQTPRRRIGMRACWFVLAYVSRAILFTQMLVRHDVFVFGGQSLYDSLRDLRVLRFFGKRIVFVYLGSDSRPAYLNGRYVAEGRIDARDLIERARRTKERLRIVERYADVIVSNPLSSQLHERPFVPFSALGFPTAEQPASDAARPDEGEAPDAYLGASPEGSAHLNPRERTEQSAEFDRPVVVLHAPSETVGKGSRRIREAVAGLVDKGYHIDYREISGQPNRMVHQELAACDFVIDQLFSDAPMAGFAREAALYGKPAVVGTYAVDEFVRGAASGTLPPCLWSHPDDLETAIQRLATNPPMRALIGERARDFVTTVWSSEAVSRRLLQLVKESGHSEEETAFEWYDPSGVTYVGGYGISAERRAAVLSAVLQEGGAGALFLDDKPTFRRLLMQTAAHRPDAPKPAEPPIAVAL